MVPIKDRLADLEAVKQQFDETLKNSLASFLNSTHVRRQAMVGNLRFALMAFFFALAVIFLLYFSFIGQPGWIAKLLLGSTMLWLAVVLLSARQWLTNYDLLAKEVNMALVPVLVGTLDRMLVYSNNVEHRQDTERLLVESELMTVDNIEVVSDDMYTAYLNQEVSFRELLVTKKIIHQGGKMTQRVELFKGIFVVADLPSQHTAETYISTDNDRVGFAHRDFWSDLTETGDVKETILEWNEFEKHLHVASSDATAAREILTPDFMQHLYDWWLEHRLNIRISFKGSKMFMLLPEDSIRIGSSTTSTKLKNIRRYAWSVVKPIWRSLMLVEDIVE